MRELAFTLNPEAVVRIHDILICIAKFNEAVNLEADDEKVVEALSSLLFVMAKMA